MLFRCQGRNAAVLWLASESLLVSVKQLHVLNLENEACRNLRFSFPGCLDRYSLLQLPRRRIEGLTELFKEQLVNKLQPDSPTHAAQLCGTSNRAVCETFGHQSESYCMQLRSVPTQCHCGCNTATGIKGAEESAPGNTSGTAREGVWQDVAEVRYRDKTSHSGQCETVRHAVLPVNDAVFTFLLQLRIYSRFVCIFQSLYSHAGLRDDDTTALARQSVITET